MYVVCLSFYAISEFVLMFFNRSNWSIYYFSVFNVSERDVNLSNFACLQLRLKEGEDISGTLVIKCGIILQ